MSEPKVEFSSNSLSKETHDSPKPATPPSNHNEVTEGRPSTAVNESALSVRSSATSERPVSSTSEPSATITTAEPTSDPPKTGGTELTAENQVRTDLNESGSTVASQSLNRPDPPLNPELFPSCYTSNNEREERLLQFVTNFRRQYVTLFPHRKELFLCIDNEFGIKKFVCATIRPTLLKFKEFYDYRPCARFVADYITYEPLNPPFDLPSVLPSPTRTLALQRGNAFDMSILLCSLLRGAGFDAFVVSGYASRQITLMDETNVDMDVDQLMEEWEMHAPYSKTLSFGSETSIAETEVKEESKYKLKSKNNLISKYVVHMEEKQKAEEEKKELKRLEALKQQYAVREDADEIAGLRIHAWVLVLPGKRDVSEAFFIEPSSGKVYDVDCIHYLGVESVFSSSNYWVNMQKCTQGLKGISFDLSDTTKWEFLFLHKSHPTYTPAMPAEEEEDEEGDKAAAESEKEVIEAGPSWVLPIELTKEQVASQCPSGAKTLTWRNVKLELFAPYRRADGMVTRITVFADPLRKVQGAVHERFRFRKDRLWKRVKKPSAGVQHEFFEHGRAHALEEHVMVYGRTTAFRFFRGARSDGLFLREETENKIMEHFEARPDRLVYLSVTHDTAPDGQSLGILKMSEHFSRRTNEEPGPADEVLDVGCNEIYKRSYYVREEKIKVTYHVPFGSLFPGWREFRKPTSDQKASFMDMTTSFETRTPKKPPKKQHLYARLCDLLKAEQACLAAIKASDREVKEIINSRLYEEKHIQLQVSLFDTIRNSFDITSEMEKETQKQAEEASKEASIDYLSPFLLHYIREDGSVRLTKEEGAQVKEHCLKALKERLIEKSSIIQKRYEEETSAYQKRQQYYSKNSETMSQAETEEYVQFCNDALFRIHVLEKRLAKHKETAPELYLALDRKLNTDPRLSSLLSTN